MILHSDLMASAAKGNASSQAALVQELFVAVESGWMDLDEAATLAEPFAWLAATHGAEADRLTLLGVLLLRAGAMQKIGRPDRVESYLADAAHLADGLLAEGNELAALQWATALHAMRDSGSDAAGARLEEIRAQFGPELVERASALGRFTADDAVAGHA